MSFPIEFVEAKKQAFGGTANDLLLFVDQLHALTVTQAVQIASLQQQLADLTTPSDRLPVSVVNDLWVSAQLRLMKLPAEVQQRWQPVASLIESQLRDAAQSGGVRRSVPWLASVITEAIADKLVSVEELAAAGLVN